MQMVSLYELTVIWETDVVTILYKYATKWKQYQLHKFRAINVTWNSQPVVVIAFWKASEPFSWKLMVSTSAWVWSLTAISLLELGCKGCREMLSAPRTQSLQVVIKRRSARHNDSTPRSVPLLVHPFPRPHSLGTAHWRPVSSVSLAQFDQWSDSFTLPADLKAADTPDWPPWKVRHPGCH